MSISSILRREDGVSYIQILLASSVIAGLAVVGLKMMENQERLARLTTVRFEMSYLVNEISYLLKDPNNCRATFAGLNASKSSRKINALKKELRGGRHKEATFYLKYFTHGSSNKLYGQKNLKIMSYSLSDEANGVDVSKGSTYLEIGFRSVFKDEQGPIITKRVPLRVTLKDEKVVECDVFNNSSGGGRSQSKESYYLGKSMHIGQRVFGANISINGSLTILPVKGKLPVCSDENRGGVVYHENTDDLYNCTSSGAWTTLGMLPAKKKGELYRVNAMDGKTTFIKTKRHRFCIIRDIKSNEKGSCRISQLESGVNHRNWKLFAEFASPRGGQFCEAECFN